MELVEDSCPCHDQLAVCEPCVSRAIAEDESDEARFHVPAPEQKEEHSKKILLCK